jgi:hypothetical protein
MNKTVGSPIKFILLSDSFFVRWHRDYTFPSLIEILIETYEKTINIAGVGFAATVKGPWDRSEINRAMPR